MCAWANSWFVVTVLLALRADAGSATDWLVENSRPPPIRVQGDAGYTEFNICNKTATDAYAAIMHLTAPGSDGRSVQGWGIVAAANCLKVGSLPQGPVCVHAFGENLSWPGSEDQLESDLEACVAIPGPFKYDLTSDRGCQNGEEVRRFFCLDVGSPTFTLDLTSE